MLLESNCFLILKYLAMTTTGKLVLGIIGAATAGVVIGLLTAPCKGSETRQKISKTTGSWVNSLGQLFTKGKHQLDGAKQKVSQARSRSEEKLGRFKDAIS
jgi:gas vesicle protein